MASGNAARIHSYLGRRVHQARSAGERHVAFMVGDVRDALDLRGTAVDVDIHQVLLTKKFPREARARFLCMAEQGLDAVYLFRVLP